jgi:lipopolysaccharide export system protein LptA
MGTNRPNAIFVPHMPLCPASLIRPLAAALCIGLLWVGTGSPALAERADRLKPMNIEADALLYDETRQTSVFTGNVVITKGTILIRGHKVDVRQDPQGNQFGVILGNDIQPAFFRQKREGLDEHIEGQAQRIEYDSQADTVRFTGQAVLRRYRGPVLNDETVGGLIVYNNLTAQFSVDGGPNSRTPDNPSGRVRAMITPNQATPPAKGQATPPATVPLQPSTRLEPRQ